MLTEWAYISNKNFIGWLLMPLSSTYLAALAAG
jgi:hypothetical protein